MHDYTVPNDPDANEWNNLALEDIGIYWDLPNFDECKHYYFQAVDINRGNNEVEPSPCVADSPDEIIESHYGWRWSEMTNKKIYQALGTVSAVSLSIAAFTV